MAIAYARREALEALLPSDVPPASDLSVVLDELADGVLRLDADGAVSFANRPARGMLGGLGGETLIGRDFMALLGPSDVGARTVIEAVARGERSDVLTAITDPRVGRRLQVRVKGMGDGGCLLVFTPASTAESVSLSLSAFFEQLPRTGVAIFDARHVYTYMGGGAWNDIEANPEDFVGLHIEQVWGPEVAAQLGPLFDTALGGTYAYDRLDWAGKAWELWVGPIPPGADGSPRGMAVSRDVTDELEQRTRLDLVMHALDNIDLGVLIADARAPDIPTIYVNPGFTRLTGYAWEEAIGRNCRFLRGDLPPQPETDVIRQALANGRSCVVTLKNRRRDGSLFDNRLSIEPVRDAEGVVTHFIGVQEDVTELLAREAELERSRRLNALGRLAGGVAHDLRNVISGVQMLLDLASDHPDMPPEALEHVQDAKAFLDRGVSVTSELLAFARVQPVRDEPVDIRSLVRQRVSLFRHLLRDDIRLHVESEDAVWARIDPGRFDQVLVNLVTNAEAALPEGGNLAFRVRVIGADEAVRIAPGLDVRGAERWVHVAVQDDGVGMSHDVRDNAFDPFFTTRADAGGSGLGLSSVFGTMRQVGGGVWLDSEVGVGTCVHLLLPEARPPSEPATAEVASPGKATGLNLLIADDEPILRRAMSTLLTLDGHHVRVAESGAEALELLANPQTPIDVLLTDVVMPGVSGLDLVAAARRHRPGMPVVLMTGYSPEVLGTAVEGVRVVSKPFDRNGLQTVLAEIAAEQAG
ncbi:MAG: PAS domain-containing sensor histidine kinase [Deltaproteobacteria bacterium]|nr:MAG: PAS domain-containing sensor histidine kinase [Deltaproteobacteria bacterium]